jgi:hypothetical protein
VTIAELKALLVEQGNAMRSLQNTHKKISKQIPDMVRLRCQELMGEQMEGGRTNLAAAGTDTDVLHITSRNTVGEVRAGRTAGDSAMTADANVNEQQQHHAVDRKRERKAAHPLHREHPRIALPEKQARHVSGSQAAPVDRGRQSAVVIIIITAVASPRSSSMSLLSFLSFLSAAQRPGLCWQCGPASCLYLKPTPEEEPQLQTEEEPEVMAAGRAPERSEQTRRRSEQTHRGAG